ncbi:helix-turn-helix domain-containing protein [Bosea sp. (in: a-proteobacteria)]|uniref:helix-turn-helix domain-containing protein n=1 Tax=Bosea sp. (in: a-proteobacteria) TaxID=1871050 RepID=UPI003F6F1369
MTATSHLLASGPGWRVRDIVCTAGPGDPVFEEQHAQCCIAVVTHGSFQYRSSQGDALLAPGSLLLGNQGACFECGHEHAAGDRCLAFQFAPDYLEEIVAAVPGAQPAFSRAHLPPSLALARLVAAAEAAPGDAAIYEDVALRLAGAVVATLAARLPAPATANARDTGRITEAVRRIEAECDEPLSLARLARDAAMSRYHFLRVFRAQVGMTPHQFLLRTRLHRAALMLRQSDMQVASIAFDAGFGDLSSFNRRFRRVMGTSPSAYRARN